MEASDYLYVAAVYAWKRALTPIEQKSGWAAELVSRLWKGEMSLHPSGIHNPDCPVCSPFTIPTMLPWLPLKILNNI
jgi:hypothetical protein